MNIGSIASVITLITFIMYLLGRIITIIAVKPVIRDKVIEYPNKTQIKAFGIVEEYPETFHENPISGLIVSKDGMRNIKIFNVDYGNPEHINPRKGDIVFEKSFLNIDEAIAIKIKPGELFPSLFIEYESMDFLKIEIPWNDNLKSGVISEFIKPVHTWKSVLYLLLR